MTRESLDVTYLEGRGFSRCGRWEIIDSRLRLIGRPPASRGVYAFALGARVMYVGLASVDLARRLRFYQNPATTQRTNVRLNAMILDAINTDTVAVLTACPPDFEWNDLRVCGAPGLEAGLIQSFDLPWNQRGQTASGVKRPAVVNSPASSAVAGSAPNLLERVREAIRVRPRSTEAEIARILFGRSGYQQKVNPICRKLVATGAVHRLGRGGISDPFVYLSAPD